MLTNYHTIDTYSCWNFLLIINGMQIADFIVENRGFVMFKRERMFCKTVYSLIRGCTDVGHDNLVHKGTKTQLEVLSDGAHVFSCKQQKHANCLFNNILI